MPALPEESRLHELMNQFAQPGRIEWIGLRPARREPVRAVPEARIEVGTGLDGDRYQGTPDSKRQVTLIQAEHLAAVASLLGRADLDPALVRRNVVVRGINLLALKDKSFRLGETVLEYTGPCQPCSRMEEILGPGGYNALRGHGGITAKVITPGRIRIGDALVPI